MITLRISLLGPLQVTIGDHPAAFRTDAERALLAYLASHQGIPLRRDTLAALLSPDRPDQAALTYLRNRLTRLRSALHDDQATPPWFVIDRKQIVLRTGDDIVIDVTQFARLMTAVESHAHRQLAGCPTCLMGLQEAVDLVRGGLLTGLNFPSEMWEGWLLGQREHVQQRALGAMTLLCDARVEQGAWAAVLDVAQRQLSLEPWLEAAHRAIMTAHARRGDRNAALAQYEECVRLLNDELGVEPEEATTALFERLYHANETAPPATPALSPVEESHRRSTAPNNLPLQTTRFFGREREQMHLLERLVDPNVRLITLVGTGGVGKTRLAVEIGQRVKASFPDGVWFLALDTVKSGAEQIKIAIGEALGLGEEDKQRTGEQVLAILRDKQILLILDNCETVLDELGFIPSWLNRAPGVAILATAREPLNFAAESVVLLEGLEMSPAANGDWGLEHGELRAAEAMFAERGQMARDGFAVTPENLVQVRQICQLVDGLPLGIALAAAWVRRRSLAQIIDSIGHSLDFLSTGLRDVDPRHRSMKAVFETSWQMLSREEQSILAALSVFPMSFSAEAAEHVAGANLFDLDLLCEKSLLQQQHEAGRYVMHSLVRQFAADKLANSTSEIVRGFVDYYYAFAREHQDDYAQLQPEWRNFAVGITKAHALAAWQTVLAFVQVLDEPWFRQMRLSEMRAGLELALDAAKALTDEAALARTLLRLGEVEIELNEYGAAEEHLGETLAQMIRLEDGIGIAHANYFLGRIKDERAQNAEALVFITESMRIFEEEEDWLGVARNLNLIAVCTIKEHRNFATARGFLERSVDLQRQAPLSSSYVETLRYLARVLSVAEAYGEAECYLAEASDVSRQQQNIGEYAAVLYERVLLCKTRGQVDEALGYGYECLDLLKRLGSLRLEALVKTQLGLLHQAKQELARGLVLLRDGLQIFLELGDRYEQAYSYYYLYLLYTEMEEPAQSLDAKQRAYTLSLALNDPQLKARLA